MNLALEALVIKLAMRMAVFSMAFLYLRNEIRALGFKELGLLGFKVLGFRRRVVRCVSGGEVYRGFKVEDTICVALSIPTII